MPHLINRYTLVDNWDSVDIEPCENGDLVYFDDVLVLINEYKTAIKKTIDENSHLADGNNSTLRYLVEVLATDSLNT